jgi:predicted  nucleic acid-binding Zn-ribbon protein
MLATIVAACAAAGTIILGVLQWKLSKRAQLLQERDSHVDEVAALRSIMDERINAHFVRLEASVAQADERIESLEKKVSSLNRRLDRAVAYIRENNLPWPPPGEDL